MGGTSALSISQTSGKIIVLDLDGIVGESQFSETEDWHDIISYSWGATKPGGGATGQSRRRGAAVINDFIFVKNLDSASPKIMEKITKGEVLPKAELRVYQDGSIHYKYELKNVMITSYFIAGSSDIEGPDLESISINFEEIKFTVTRYDDEGKSQGNVEAEYKVEQGET
jgi:type VI secretion system secreted protein Hcp